MRLTVLTLTAGSVLPKIYGSLNLPASMLVRVAHVASVIANANHGAMCPTVKLCVADCVGHCIWLAIPHPTEWQRVGDQIDAALVAARMDFVNVL